MLLVRSSDQPARAAASGSIDWRAVVPAGSKPAARKASTASSARLIASAPNNSAISGTAATADAGQRIGDQRNPAPPEEVDRGAGDQRGDHQRQRHGGGHDRRVARAVVVLQRQPRERDDRDAGTGRRHQRGEQDQKRWAAAGMAHGYRGLNLTRISTPVRSECRMFMCSSIRIPARRSILRCRPAADGRAIRPRRRPRWPPTPRRVATLAAQAGSISELDAAQQRVPRLPAAGHLARGGGDGQTPRLRRPAVLGTAGAGLGIGAAAAADRRAGARRARRQPDRADVHRRPVRRPVVRRAAPGRAGEPADQCRRRRRFAGQPDSHRRAGAVRAAGQRPDACRTGHLLALAGCRMAAGVATMSVSSSRWAGSPGRSRCDCRAWPVSVSRGSATAWWPSCRRACVCSAATTRASKICSPVG